VHWKDLPTPVVAPQSYERHWSLRRSPLPAEQPLVMNILAALEREFYIDPDRIYLATYGWLGSRIRLRQLASDQNHRPREVEV